MDSLDIKPEFKTLTEEAEISAVWHSLASSFDPPLDQLILDLDALCAKISQRAVTIACLVDSELAGAVSFYANDVEERVAYISEIASDKRFRGCGIGSALLDECNRISCEAGMHEVRLEVRKDNQIARAFYAAKGFETFEDRGRVLLMARAL